MGKKKKRKQPYLQKNSKEYVVITKHPEDYAPFDIRSNKPICYKDNSNGGSMVLQEFEEIEFSTRIKDKKNKLEYYAPNNVGVLLSISQKSLTKAHEIFKEYLNPDKFNHLEVENASNKNESLIGKSKIVYDFIEEIQTSIVFGFTALEAFANLSIPNDYKYQSPPNSKGVVEIFDKQAIERWTSLRVKLSDILVEIHETPDIKKTKVWGQYLEFEKMRNQIVHQKSIGDTDFYKKYLQSGIFTSCETPIEVIKFFYAALHEKNQTNPLWPWIVNMKASLPVSYNYDPGKFEVIGNIYEGKK